MKFKEITLKEYCELSGYSYKSRYVHRQLKNGDLTVGMISAKKFGWAYMVTVLETWYKTKTKERNDRINH